MDDEVFSEGILGDGEKKMAINFSIWENMSNFAAQKNAHPNHL